MISNKLIEQIFFALLTSAAGLAVRHLGNLSSSVSSMNLSITELNARMEIIAYKLTSSEQKLFDLSQRLNVVEKKR
jgi:hypothetical protein